MRQDIRYALRILRQNPGFALTAILSIALGIGANATIFSLADGLLLRPLPVARPGEVVTLQSRTPSGTFSDVSYPDFVDFRDRDASFESLTAYTLSRFGFAADSQAQPQMKLGLLVSGNFFRVLGTEPRLGRGFRPEEDQVPGRDAVLVLGYAFWQTEFSADPSVIGRRVRVNSIDFTVVGIAPESFTGMDQYFRPSFYVPVMMAPKLMASGRDLLGDRKDRTLTVKGRLRTGVSMPAANAAAESLAKALEQSNPNTNRAFGAAVRTELQVRMYNSQGDAILVALLSSIVFVVLLIACANVANLLLSRARQRSREIAVRLAVGAGRGRLVRQLFAESLVIALGGGAVGLAIAACGVEVISTVKVPSDLPIELTFQLDLRVVAFTFVLSFISAIVFGFVPALQSTRTDLVSALKAGSADQGRKRWFGRHALVVVQVAGSLVLLVAATQMFRGFAYVLAHNPGFRRDHLLMMTMDPALIRYSPAQTEQFYNTLVERTRSLPGVKSAALAYTIPFSMQHQEAVVPEGFQFPKGKESEVIGANLVDEHFFATFGVPLLRGRGFLPTDRADTARVAVVNQQFANHYAGADPIGKRFRLNDKNGPWVEIVGVAATGKYITVAEPPTEFIYLPASQQPKSEMVLLVESYEDPATMAEPVRAIVRSIEANMPVFGIRTMGDFYEQRSVKVLHLITGIVGTVGLVGLGLALIGLYAVVAYSVAGRTREIGIRMAIGADRRKVVKMIVKQALILGGAGIGLGLLLSLIAGRALTAGIGVPSFDPLLFALVPTGLLVTTLLAAAIPARRAARIDPMEALRQD